MGEGFRFEINGKLVSPSDAYNIMSGVRGPDIDNIGVLKHIFTERIRYFVLREKENCPGFMRTRKLIDSEMLHRAICEVEWLRKHPILKISSVHYFSHVKDALMSLAGYLGLEEREEADMLRSLASVLHEYLLYGWETELYNLLEAVVKSYPRFFVNPDKIVDEIRGGKCEGGA